MLDACKCGVACGGIRQFLPHAIGLNMAELVNALEERTITWPEKWRANYIAEGRVGLLVSMVRQRFGEAVASTVSALLGAVRTESALEQVGAWLLTGDALIAKIRQL